MRSTYSLAEIKRLILEGRYFITQTAMDTAFRDFGFDEEAILQVVQTLKAQDCYKTMPSEKMPGVWQDVYKPQVYRGAQILTGYVKLQIRTGRTGEQSVIISFKEA